jgi:SAM-dependent methyltransferase
MTFAVAGDAYDRYMGRYSRELAPRLIEFAGIEPGMRVLDVGCGPGPLTEPLAERVGADHVAAADPSEPFVAACAERVPGADVRRAVAEELPWPDKAFDAAMAQLVVNFMRDAYAGVGQMRRVVRPGGMVAACTWDYGHGMQLLRTFWGAARDLDPKAPDEALTMRYITPDDLDELWRHVGCNEITTEPIVVDSRYADFADLWDSVMLGVGPAGAYSLSLDPSRRDRLRDEVFSRLDSPDGPFTLTARAWAVRGVR